MGSESDELRQRLERLELRVAELESAAARREVAAPAAQPPRPETPRPVPPITPVVFTPIRPGPARIESISHTAPAPPPSPPAVQTTSTSRPNLERFIGGRFYAAVGAVVVVIGVGMFLKLAVERGWFRFPPSARCAAAAGFGLALLAAGELARRKIGAVASVGLSAAGIATTYAAVVAAYGWYSLMGAAPSMALLALVSAIGVVVALRAGQALLAWIALVAAYFSPLVLWKAGMSVLVSPLYLVAVLGFALTLAARRPRPFASVRGVAWWGTVLIGTAWALASAQNHAPVVAGFVLVVWAMVHAEMAISAPAEDRAGRGLWRRALLSVGSTTWAALMGGIAANWSRGPWAPSGWMITGAMFAASCALAHLLSGPLQWLMDRPETERQRMGAVLWLESGALLIATLAMGIDGSAEVICWLGLGAAALVAARWIGSRALAGYGLIVLAIAVGRLLIWESWHGGPGTVVVGVYMNKWTALMAGAVVALGAAAALLRVRAWAAAWAACSDACTMAACVLAVVAAVHERSEPLSVAAWAALVCAVAWALTARLRSAPMAVFAAIASAAVLALASGAQNSGMDRARTVAVVGLMLGPWSVVVAVLAGVWGFAAWTCAVGRVAASSVAVVGCAFGGGLAMMLIPDVPMSRGSSLVVYWSVIAGVLLAAHTAWKRTLPSGLALAALAAAAVAWAYHFPLSGWGRTEAPVLLHPGLWLAGLLSLLGWGAQTLLRREGDDARVDRPRGAIIFVAIGVMLFTATSLEAARVARAAFASDRTSQDAAVSIWWGCFAIVLLVIGFARRAPVVRHVGLGLLGLAVAKAVVMDLREVSPEWRVASFLGLGLLMLAVAVGYARLSRRLDDAAGPRIGQVD